MFTTNAKTPRLLQIGRLIFMHDSVLSPQAPRKPEDARDLQAKLYREIGITAVAAALAIHHPTRTGDVVDRRRSRTLDASPHRSRGLTRRTVNSTQAAGDQRSVRPSITRRRLLLGSGAAALGLVGTGGYAVAVEPFMTPRLTRYALVPAALARRASS